MTPGQRAAVVEEALVELVHLHELAEEGATVTVDRWDAALDAARSALTVERRA